MITKDTEVLQESYRKIYEHHEQYPLHILNMTVSDLLEKLKGVDTESYNQLEGVIDKLLKSPEKKSSGILI